MDGMQGSHIQGCVIGCNTFIANGCHVEDCMLMGNDNYTNDRERERARQQGMSVLGIGRSNTHLSISWLAMLTSFAKHMQLIHHV